MSDTTSIVIAGAAGRMGKMLIRFAHEFPGLELAGAVEAPGHPDLGKDSGALAGIGENGIPLSGDLTAALSAGDVLIDFTFHTVVPGNARVARELGKPVVIGTTGLDDTEKEAVHAAGVDIPIVLAPNMSLGMNLLFALVRRAAEVLGPDYDIEILETHHRHKKDAPSGTAIKLAERAAEGRGVALDAVACYGREGIVGERPEGQIGIHAVRAGDVVGDHTVLFGAEGESIELSHRASNREAFATGALHAARWVVAQPPGVYDMQPVLGL